MKLPRPSLLMAFLWSTLAGMPLRGDEPAALEIGNRRELFVDDFLLAPAAIGVELRMHKTYTARGHAIVHDAPWEGSGCGYETVFRDGDHPHVLRRRRADERGRLQAACGRYACYAESKDGTLWTKPELGLFEFTVSKHNNIVWTAPRPTTSRCSRTRIRTVGRVSGTRPWPPVPADYTPSNRPTVSTGPRWRTNRSLPRVSSTPKNIAFWDPLRKHYWAYLRDFHNGIRDIRVATSTDFLAWTEPELLAVRRLPDLALYTNQVLPYYRAPHLFVGFPTRYVERPFRFLRVAARFRA